jgi:hypothetical protein
LLLLLVLLLLLLLLTGCANLVCMLLVLVGEAQPLQVLLRGRGRRLHGGRPQAAMQR